MPGIISPPSPFQPSPQAFGALQVGALTVGSINPIAGQTIAVGTGDDVSYLLGGLGVAQAVDMRWGTAASPITSGSGPMLKLSKTESIPLANMPLANGANVQGNTVFWASSTGDVNTQGQVTAIYGSAITRSTQSGGLINHDALGVAGHGFVTGGGIGYGIGGYFEARRDGSAGHTNAVEGRSHNFAGVDGVYAPTTASDTMGFWATAGGGNDSAAAFIAGAYGTGNAWKVGFAAVTGSCADYFARDDSGATNGILINHSRTGYAMAIANGAGNLLVGETTALSSSSLLEVMSASATSRDPIARWGGPGATDNFSMRLNNGTGTVYFAFVAGASNAFLANTAAGDTGIKVATAGKAFHIGGGNKVLTVDGGDHFGAFGTAPVAQQSGTPAAAADLATVITLANFLRTSQLAYGWVA